MIHFKLSRSLTIQRLYVSSTRIKDHIFENYNIQWCVPYINQFADLDVALSIFNPIEAEMLTSEQQEHVK